MILFDEYSTEKLDSIIADLNRFFYLIDKDFFSDFDRLRDEITDEYGFFNNNKTLQISGDLAGDIPLEESIRIAGEVFESINPKYKEMFLNLIRDPKYKIHYAEGNQTNYNDDLYLNGTIDDVLVIVHEFAHNFVSSDGDGFFLNLFGEVNAILWEKIAVDYLASHYNTYIDNNRARLIELMNYRTKSLKKFYMDLLEKSKNGIDKDGFFEVYREASIPVRLFLDSNLLLSRFGTQLFLFSNYYHDIGFVLANSIYQDCIGNMDCIYKLYDVERVNSFSDDLLSQGLSIFYEDDIPIIHDGKISLKGSNYNRLLSSLQETMKRERVKEKVE